jgi:ferredoxin
MNTGPELPPTHNNQFDIALTELPDAAYLLRIGSQRGQEIANLLFKKYSPQLASLDQLQSEKQTVAQVKSNMKRSLPTENLKENLLKQLQNPHWDDVASRCLSCANCTMVCPTCFCSSVDEVHDLTDESIYRQRRWDSCFNPDFSHTSGAPVRNTIRARYRQWVTHKLATWFDQFGSSGCVGCGRCITWCPVGIDLTAEVAKLVAPTPEPNAP